MDLGGRRARSLRKAGRGDVAGEDEFRCQRADEEKQDLSYLGRKDLSVVLPEKTWLSCQTSHALSGKESHALCVIATAKFRKQAAEQYTVAEARSC